MPQREVFEQLKRDLLRKYQAAYPHFSGKLSDFRQKDIANFQNLLTTEAQGRVSEKWFYTHLKGAEQDKLPRIDILDLLSRFVGHQNWESYCIHYEKLPESRRKTNWWSLVWLVPILLLGIAWKWTTIDPLIMHLQFIDALRQKPITETTIQVTVVGALMEEQLQFTNQQGLLSIENPDEETIIYTQAAYFLPDTFSINQQADTIFLPLRTDDYALMIHYFSTAKIADWQRRRQQLDQIFADDAIIYQLDPAGNLGMDILNKQEFIDKLSIPINSLRDVKVWSTIYQDQKIKELRFSTP